MKDIRERGSAVYVLAGLAIFLVGIACAHFSNILDRFPFFDPHRRVERKFQSVEGAECIPDLNSYEIGTLIEIIDGDSIRVSIEGETVEVRYIGIDSPEYFSEERSKAQQAKDMNRKLIADVSVYMFKDTTDKDQYDRLLRYVIANQRFVNLEMVRSGFAISKAYYPDISCQQVFDLETD